jgi:hypothetical protein
MSPERSTLQSPRRLAPRWWRIAVWSGYALAVAAAATITLGGTYYPDWVTDSVEFGWPWSFGQVYYPSWWTRFAFFQAPIAKYPQAFLRDAAVLAAVIVALDVARRWLVRRRPQLSLRTAAVAVTLLCLLLGYGVMHYQRGARILAWQRRLREANCYYLVSERPPVWLQRLTGECFLSHELFAVPDVHLQINAGFDLETVLAALDELPQLHSVKIQGWMPVDYPLRAEGVVQFLIEDARQKDLAALLRHRQFQNVRELILVYPGDCGDALRELQNCSQLEGLWLDGLYDLADAAIEHCAGLPRLKALSLVDSRVTRKCIPALQQIPNLKVVHLFDLEPDDPDLEAFREQLPNLKVIGAGGE